MPHNTRKKQRAYRFGKWAEYLAVCLLMLKGYRILAYRYKNHGGEVDIVASRASTISMVEVKARRNAQSLAYSISEHQKNRIMRGASHFIAGKPHLADRPIRFDVIFIAPWHFPRHITSAWS